ncbi:MAG TPA: MMPL family transporter, partial [Bacteroidales bacterium]|nr:MMPL family transporter [Bacteroidales bacterium]
TTIAGLLGLLTHSVIPAKQAGILASSGVFAALLLSLSFIPALLCRRKNTMTWKKQGRNNDIINNLIVKSGEAVIRHPGAVLLIAFLFTLAVSSCIFFLAIETNQENFFPANNPVRKASDIINRKFGGSQTVSVMVSGDIKDPSVMRSIDELSSNLTDLKGVGDVYSISQVVREMSKAIFDKGDPEYNSIPMSREAIAQMFELYYMSGDQGDFRQLINHGNTRAHILVKLSEPSEDVISDVQGSISGFIPPPGTRITTGGNAIIMADFARLIFRGQVKSLILALSLVLILLTIIFRSLKAGIISSVPLALSILILFGFMGFTGIAIDAATALLSSIMIGVGVDFTIQFLWHFKRVLAKGSSYKDSVMISLTEIGRRIMINALAVMSGFSVLIFSGFSSIRFFGYLVFISIGSCLAGALVIIPAILVFFRPSCFRREQKIQSFMRYIIITGNKDDK